MQHCSSFVHVVIRQQSVSKKWCNSNKKKREKKSQTAAVNPLLWTGSCAMVTMKNKG